MKKKDKKIGPIKRKTYYIIAVLFLFLLFGVVLAHNFSCCHISLFGGSYEEFVNKLKDSFITFDEIEEQLNNNDDF